MDYLPTFSELSYLGLCKTIGWPSLVSIRREVTDIVQIINTPVHKRAGIEVIISGSRREGFGCSKTSDIDYMIWPTDHHVIWDLNHADEFNTERCTLILMECSKERPGFAMLQLLTPSTSTHVSKSSVRINDKLYISSKKYRENAMFLFRKKNIRIQHGPCVNLKIGVTDYDLAHCFACKHWPSIGTSFILRCRSQAWPPDHVLREIVNSGCHVVSVGFKGSPQEDCEWRISFSAAEQKLLHCMNHTQFLCFGLLKVFLKEALTTVDTNGQPLLCSYFMKTVLFWVIHKNILAEWNPSSLLRGFWLCVKFLMSCVYHGILQNFFICENNLFICKVIGHSQHVLYERLIDLYDLGISCIFHCHSLRNYLITAVCGMHILYLPITTCITESNFISEVDIDCELNFGMDWVDSFDRPCFTTGMSFNFLHSALRCVQARNTTPWQHVALRTFILSMLRSTIYYLCYASSTLHNKNRLRIMYTGLNLLELSLKIGCISHRIYLVLFLYSVGKIKDAITNLTKIKTVLEQPYIMCNENVDEQKYINKVGGRSPSDRRRIAVASDIRLCSFIVKELELECCVTTNLYIRVPPYVLTLMLLVLCYRGNPQKQHKVLHELYILLHFDEGRHIIEVLRDISWQILGICQQVCGDYEGALSSYRNSLNEIPYHKIQEATYCRIKDVLYRLQYSRAS